MLFAQKERMKVISKIKATIAQCDSAGLTVNKDKLISEICINQGSTKIKAREYIDDIINSGFCSDNNGELQLNENERKRMASEEFDSIIKNEN